MHRNTKGILAKTLVLAMALTTVVTAAPDADAAKAKKPKLSKSKVTVAEKKTAKIKIKNVKAKQVKKLTVKSAKKATATVKKNGKTAFTITGKKAGKTTVTASVKVGKKTTKLKVAVTVTGAETPDKTAAPTVTPSTAPSAPAPTASAPAASAPASTAPAPTEPAYVRKELKLKNKDVKVDVDPASDPETMKDSNPRIEAPETVYTQDFENVKEIGTGEFSKPTDPKAAWQGEERQCNIGGILSGRGNEKFEIADGGVDGGKCLKITERWKFWHGVRINLEEVGDIINKGGTYKFSAKVKIGENAKSTDKIAFSEEVKTMENANESYNDMQTLDCPTEWTEISGTFSVPDSFYHYAVYLQNKEGASQTGDADGNTWFPDIYVDDVKIECLEKVNPLENLTSLYETYKDTIPYVGTACSYSQILGKECVDFMASQYNCVTPGNEMKPDAIMGSQPTFLTLAEAKEAGYFIPEGYEADADNMKNGEVVVPKMNFEGVDQFLKAAKEAGLKVRPHTLVWHEQTPVFFFQKEYKTQKNNPKNNYNVSAETMNGRLELYIRTVMDHVLGGEYADVVYAWDVVNEYFHSSDADSRTLPTYYKNIYGTYVGKEGLVENGTQSSMTTEPSYVKLAFKIAHDELVKYNKVDQIKLFYNDFNTYDVTEDICHLVNYVNNEEKLMDGVGMQTHLDLTYPSIENYKKTLEMFRVNIPDVEIQITELDVTMNKNIQTGKHEDKGHTDKMQGAYYFDLMKAILQEKKAGLNLTGLLFWSLYDGVSWRASETPCIFNGLNSPKSAYYAVLDAKDAVK